MNPQLSFIEWLSEALRLIESDDVSLHVRRQSGNLLEASLSSVLKIDGTRQGVRRFVLLAVDGGAEHSEVERFCLEYSSQVGVVDAFLLSSGVPDERTSQVLANHRVRSVAIPAGEGYTSPTSETIANFGRLLLGGVWVSEIGKRLEALEESAAAPEQGERAEDLLRSAYSTLLPLYFSELEILAEGGGGRDVVGVSESGVESAMWVGYAVQSYPLDGRRMNVFLPNRSHLEDSLVLAASAYGISLRVKRAGHDGSLAQMVDRVSRRFLVYYLSWVEGSCHELPHEELREEFARFVGVPYISILASRLPDFMPDEQIHFLELFRWLRAREATGDLLESLDSMVPKVQEVCLETLADFGTLEDPSRLEPFITSRRDSLREAAFKVIGKMGGDEAAMYLIHLINTEIVPLSESALNSMASTRSVLALGSLIRFSADREEAQPWVLNAVESCLDAVAVDDVRRDGAQYVPTDVLVRYVAFLFETGDHPAKRLALKLIAAFQLSAGVEYVEQALQDESLVTRLNAIRAVASLPDDQLVRTMTDSVASLPEDSEAERLVEWMTANIFVRQHRDGPGRIASVAELDLRNAVIESLSKAGTELAEACLEELSTTDPTPLQGWGQIPAPYPEPLPLTRVALPVMPMFLPGPRLSSAISANALAARISVEFCQSADVSVPETTYLVVPFMVSAISPVWCGQCAAKVS